VGLFYARKKTNRPDHSDRSGFFCPKYRKKTHDIRHTHASLIINNGGSLYDVQAALGHASSSISERYAHLSSESMTKTSANISNVVLGAIVRKNVEAGLSMGSIM
jgi:integrase